MGLLLTLINVTISLTAVGAVSLIIGSRKVGYDLPLQDSMSKMSSQTTLFRVLTGRPCRNRVHRCRHENDAKAAKHVSLLDT